MPAITVIPADRALYRLAAWLSPAFPVGAFSYSHGLEAAVEAGLVRDRAGLEDWIGALLAHGAGWNDAILLVHAHACAAAGDATGLGELRALAAALAPSAELALETRSQATAFARTCLLCWPDPGGRLGALVGEPDRPPPLAYPIAVGAVAGCHGIAREPALLLFLEAFAHNLVSAALRLLPMGQSEGQRVLAALEPGLLAVAERAAVAPLDALGGAALAQELGSLAHETQYSRLFRS